MSVVVNKENRRFSQKSKKPFSNILFCKVTEIFEGLLNQAVSDGFSILMSTVNKSFLSVI